MEWHRRHGLKILSISMRLDAGVFEGVIQSHPVDPLEEVSPPGLECEQARQVLRVCAIWNGPRRRRRRRLRRPKPLLEEPHRGRAAGHGAAADPPARGPREQHLLERERPRRPHLLVGESHDEPPEARPFRKFRSISSTIN
jgi:hypothetical protein